MSICFRSIFLSDGMLYAIDYFPYCTLSTASAFSIMHQSQHTFTIKATTTTPIIIVRLHSSIQSRLDIPTMVNLPLLVARRASHMTTATARRSFPSNGVCFPQITSTRFTITETPLQPPALSVTYNQQIRTVTKKRLHRQEKRKKNEILAAQGIPIPKPHNYIPKDTPVINAVSKEERLADSKRQDERAAQELQERMQIQQDTKPEVLRFGFTDSNDLVMSDRVRKLLNLHNGSQKEVVKAQKQQAMEIFQLREGDTGSSAVQVIALTTRIQQIQTHYTKHKKDKHSKRGLDALYVRRRKLLDYMERKEFESYRKVVKTLGLNH